MTNATKAKAKARRAGAVRTRQRTNRGRGSRSSSTWIAIGAVVAVVIVAAMFFSGGRDDDGGFTPSPTGTVSIDRAGGPMLAAGEQVPDFAAPSLGGGPLRWSDVEGTPTVLSIWAPWCPHCRAELPRLEAAVDARPGIQLVTVTTAYGAQPGPTPPAYMAEEGLSFPVAVDDEAQTLLTGFGVQSFPTTYYVAPDGSVVDATTGEVLPEELDAILDDLVAR